MLSVIIPAYNEENRIEATIGRIREYGRGRDIEIEILVVDDGSTDDTARIAGNQEGVVLLSAGRNRGKGWAVREGMKHFRGDVALFTDADMSAPIEEADRLMEAIESGCDIAVGSRMARPSRIEKYQPWYRIVLGLIFGAIVRVIFSPGIKDTQCGFKMFTAESAHELARQMTVDGYTFDVEMLVLAKRLGLKVAEVSVKWSDMPGSKLKVLKTFPQVIRELTDLRRRLKSMDSETDG